MRLEGVSNRKHWAYANGRPQRVLTGRLARLKKGRSRLPSVPGARAASLCSSLCSAVSPLCIMNSSSGDSACCLPASPQTPVHPETQGMLSTQCSHALTGLLDSWVETGQVEYSVSSRVQGLREGGVDTLQIWMDTWVKEEGGAECGCAALTPALLLSVTVVELLGPSRCFFS